MNTAPTAPAEQIWPWHRWVLFIGLTFAFHLGFIFALGDRGRTVPRATVNAPALQFTTQRNERQRLDDPTLFALPHPNGFAGEAWLRKPHVEFAPFRWTEPPRPLALAVAQLGATFQQLQQTNRAEPLALETMPPPELSRIELADWKTNAARRSTASRGGELIRRRWLNEPTDLPPWPAADLLTNSVVQVWVEADGQVLSPALLLPGSGSREADQLALKLARTARFAPLPGGATKLTHGTLVFEWHTVTQTNQIPTAP